MPSSRKRKELYNKHLKKEYQIPHFTLAHSLQTCAGLFTEVLLKHFTKPNLDVGEMLKLVGKEVSEKSNHKQQPVCSPMQTRHYTHHIRFLCFSVFFTHIPPSPHPIPVLLSKSVWRLSLSLLSFTISVSFVLFPVVSLHLHCNTTHSEFSLTHMFWYRLQTARCMHQSVYLIILDFVQWDSIK